MFKRSVISAATVATLALSAAPALAGVSFTSSSGTLSATGSASSTSSTYTKQGYNFNIGYSANLSAKGSDLYIANGRNSAYSGQKSFSASGSFEVPVTIFSKSLNLVKLTADANASTSSTVLATAGGNYQVSVAGATVKSGSAGLPYSGTIASYCATFAKVSVPYTFVGIPITVSASANGCAYIDATMSVNTSDAKLSFTATPRADISASLGVSVGVDWLASAGVTGTMKILQASLPLATDVQVKSNGVSITESGSLTLSGLSGSVKVYGKALTYTVFNEEIFSWTGMSYGAMTLFPSQTQSISW